MTLLVLSNKRKNFLLFSKKFVTLDTQLHSREASDTILCRGYDSEHKHQKMKKKTVFFYSLKQNIFE